MLGRWRGAVVLRPEGHPLLAATLDWVMWPLDKLRPRVVGRAAGRVLELGVGTGLNLPHYDRSAVTEWHGIEPDPHMVTRAQARLDTLGFPGQLHRCGAEDLPFADDSFDCAVVTFVFCTIPDLDAALDELVRVLAPGGALHLAEHTGSDHGVMRSVQGGLEPAWKRLAGGCHLTRDPGALLRERGFDGELRGSGRGPLNLTPLVWGTLSR